MLRLLKALLATSLALLVTWIIISACDDNKPTEPPPPPEPKDYVVYFWDGGDVNQYFAFHTLSHKLDSFTLGLSRPLDIEVSADGRLLYITRRGGMTTVVDTNGYSVVTELPYSGIRGVAVSPNNQHLAVFGWDGDFDILSTGDYSVIHHDTDNFGVAAFSANGERFYGVAGSSVDGNYVYRLDLSDNNSVSRTVLPEASGSITDMRPSADETKWFLYRHVYNDLSYFDVYDVQTDSIVFSDLLFPGAGRFAIAPDGNHVCITAPGTLMQGAPPQYSFAIYDIQTMTIDSIQVASICYGGPTGNVCTQIVVTPDGQFALGNDLTRSPGMVLFYDLLKRDTVASLCLGTHKYLMYPACQNSL